MVLDEKKEQHPQILHTNSTILVPAVKKKNLVNSSDSSCEIIFGGEIMIFSSKLLYREHAYRHQQQLNLQFGGFGLTFWFYLTGISCDCLGVSSSN